MYSNMYFCIKHSILNMLIQQNLIRLWSYLLEILPAWMLYHHRKKRFQFELPINESKEFPHL